MTQTPYADIINEAMTYRASSCSSSSLSWPVTASLNMGCYAFQAAEDEHIQRCRKETVAMRAEPLKRLLMQQLMPVLAKALVEATDEQAADPVQFVAHKLLQVWS